MGKYVEPEVLITSRTTSTASPDLWKLYSAFSDEYDEVIGINTQVFADGTADEIVSLGTISIGKLIMFKSDEEISLKLNGGSEDTPLFTFLLMISDETTGISGITLSNDSGSTATVEYLIAGDVSS